MMIRAYRMRGHFHADLDPLGLSTSNNELELDPTSYGFTEADFGRRIFLDNVLGLQFATLPEMVDSLRAALPDDARDMLDQGLEEMGYSDAHRKLYSRTRYQQLDLLHFEVRDGFPRLTRDQISEGVKSVRYDLSVDACKPFRTDEAALLKRITENGG